jgi:hypothetical protein
MEDIAMSMKIMVRQICITHLNLKNSEGTDFSPSQEGCFTLTNTLLTLSEANEYSQAP